MAKETVKEEKVLDVTETPVTADESVKTLEVNGETILNGGKDVLELNAKEGIDDKAEGSKETLDTQKKAEAAIKDGTSGLDAIGTSEVQSGLIKDYNSDRAVYPTASAWLAATTAAGKLGG